MALQNSNPIGDFSYVILNFSHVRVGPFWSMKLNRTPLVVPFGIPLKIIINFVCNQKKLYGYKLHVYDTSLNIITDNEAEGTGLETKLLTHAVHVPLGIHYITSLV